MKLRSPEIEAKKQISGEKERSEEKNNMVQSNSHSIGLKLLPYFRIV